jgi:hypothetical protein
MTRASFAFPGVQAARVGLIRDSAAPVVFPWPGAAADLDFVRRQYFWNGAARTEANFTTLVLNGATWGVQGLDVSTATVNPDITISLATLAIAMPPCVYAFAGYFLSTPAASKTILEFDNASNNERFFVNLTSGPQIQVQTVTGGVSQASQTPGSISTPSTRFGIAHSAQLNEVLAAGNGIGAAADVVATMPTVTTLRLGANAGAGNWPPAILSRLLIFSAVKIQADINQLSIDVRDTP